MQKSEKLAVNRRVAAEMLSIGYSTLRKKIARREIAVCRATRRPTIAVDELNRYMARNTVKL